MATTHIVATPAALDAAQWPADALVLRVAADEALVLPPLAEVNLADPHAIIVPDSGYAGAWMAADEALAFLERTCEWELPNQRPAFAQGAVAGIATKLWLEQARVLFVVPAPFIEDFQERYTNAS
jgi:hypothetical protein